MNISYPPALHMRGLRRRHTDPSEVFEQLCRRAGGVVVESRHPYPKVTTGSIGHDSVMLRYERRSNPTSRVWENTNTPCSVLFTDEHAIGSGSSTRRQRERSWRGPFLRRFRCGVQRNDRKREGCSAGAGRGRSSRLLHQVGTPRSLVLEGEIGS